MGNDTLTLPKGFVLDELPEGFVLDEPLQLSPAGEERQIKETLDISEKTGIPIHEVSRDYEFLQDRGGRFKGSGATGTWEKEGWRGWKREIVGVKEKFLETDALDFITHLPGAALVGLNDIRRKIYETAKQKLSTGDYSPSRRWGITPMGGYMTIDMPTTRENLQKVVDLYEERELNGEGTLASIMSGIADLPGYMGEMAAGGIGKVNSIPKAFAFAGKMLTVQFGRVESALNRQLDMGEKGYTALAKAIGDVYIENLSETAGAGFPVLAKKLPFGSKIIDGLHDFARKAGISDSAFWKRMGTKLGYHGLLSEWGEERLGTYLRGLVGTEDFGAGKDATADQRIMAGLAQDLEFDNQIKELGILSVPGK